MTVPDGFPHPPFAELTMALPADWPMRSDAFDDERAYWPVRLMKQLGRLPHDDSTFLWWGQHGPERGSPEPYADGTRLCCALTTFPVLAPDEFSALELDDGRCIRFLGVVPLYEDE